MKNSKKLLSIVVGLALVSPTALFAEEAKVAEKPAVVAAKDVAMVNGTAITKETLDAYLAVINRSRPEGGVSPKEALDDLIITELALQQAKKDGVAEREVVKKQIAEAAKKVILTTWTREKSENMKIADAELKAAYDESMKDQASKEFKARHILVEKEDVAKAIIKEIAGGGDFEKLAKEKSTGPSGSKGGDLGWFKPSTMVPPFAKAVEAMKKGDVSKEPVKTNFGWHIIKLEDIRDAKLPTFESMKPQMKPMLAQKKMIEYIESLRKTADIKITLPEEKAAVAPKADAKPADAAEKKVDAKPADTAEKKEEAKPADAPETK
jgi:peptidyl-prolyl cis-trans isomerase C